MEKLNSALYSIVERLAFCQPHEFSELKMNASDLIKNLQQSVQEKQSEWH